VRPAARPTRAQRRYLREAAGRGHLQYGWGGYKSTQTVRILEERGLIRLSRNHCAGARWCITGITAAGLEALED
jgi:hypothetical protein